MRRILVPVDFSPASANALRYANDYALKNEMTLSLLYCYPFDKQSRKYDFDEVSYDKGIQKMLAKFYIHQTEQQIKNTKFIARMGSMVEKVILISSQYDLIITSGNPFNSAFQRWVGSKTSNIASNAKCPVLIIPTIADYYGWRNIWHLQRNLNELEIVTPWLEQANIDPAIVKVKTLKQKTFTSVIWEYIVRYIQEPKEDLRELILKEIPSKKISLIILVSQSTYNFQKFLNDEAKQIIFEFGIPVMIFQTKKQ